MYQRIEPISGKCGAIIEMVMASKDMPSDESDLFKIRLSVEEVLENIINYAYGSSDGWLSVETSRKGNELKIVFKDGGVKFDPLAKEDPDITSSLEDRNIGGLGIFLCKQMMDSLEYRYEDGCNILSMTKIS